MQAVPQLPSSVPAELPRVAEEVYTGVLAARLFPRDAEAARSEMLLVCGQRRFADQAFYSFWRDDELMTGPTVYLAREIARIWGHVQHGVTQVSWDEELGLSRMQAWAWDVQANVRASTEVIVPARQDGRDGGKLLSDRDVYEHNASVGARRLRAMILGVLPHWYVEEAKDACHETLTGGGDTTLTDLSLDMVGEYDKLGIGVDRLERYVGRDADAWSGYDVASLRVLLRSVQRREIDVFEVIPEGRVTLEELHVEPPADPKPEDATAGKKPSKVVQLDLTPPADPTADKPEPEAKPKRGRSK
ncbi:hypothetical protein [Microtetraspora malaysiensis]|uniref:Uncharacterized protein n=1 Tax=Microtetraspora malaysiensis TaxID=161358 RepID=A0ABW6SNG8_9ACTN